jgi:hypothetical protein
MAPIVYPSTSPQSIGQTMDTAFRIFQRSLAKCLPHGVLSMIAGQLANIYYLTNGKRIGGFGAGDPLWLGLYSIGALVGVLLWSAMLLKQRNILAGERIHTRTELAEAGRRMPVLVAFAVMATLAIAGGVVLLVIPGLYMVVALIPAWPILLLEKRGPLSAIRQSVHLIKGHWWRSAVILTLGFIIAIVFYFAVFVLMAMVLPLFGANDVAMFTAASAVVAVVLGAVGVPFYGALVLALYYDLKLRKEGIDLEQRLPAAAQG